MTCKNNSSLISISKFTKKHSISTSKVISHLIKNEKLVADDLILKSNDHFIKNDFVEDKKILKVNEKVLFDYLCDDWDRLVIKDEEKDILSDIDDTKILFDKLVEANSKKIMFLDFEFKNSNFYEVAFSIYDNRVLKSKKYLFVEGGKSAKKINKIRNKKVDFEVVSHSKAVNTLLDAVSEVDYIIAHNSFCERSILLKNGIFLKKNKFICTSNIFKKANEYPLEISLGDALRFYNKKFDSNLPHFAFYDIEMCKMLFDCYIDLCFNT